MRKVVKLHGTCGSGKTTIARKFMEEAIGVTPLYGSSLKRPEAYKMLMPGWKLPLIILGPYETICGGLDALDSDTCLDLVSRYGDRRDAHVFYESMIASGFYGRMGKKSEDWGADHIWAFMATPIEVCIERTVQRRAARGNTKPFDPVNVIDKDRAMVRLIERLHQMGGKTIANVSSYYDVVELFNEGNAGLLDSGTAQDFRGEGSGEASSPVDDRPHPTEV